MGAIWYNGIMSSKSTFRETVKAAERRRDAIALHDIEGNPFTPEDEALFRSFDADGLSPEDRIERIRALVSQDPRRAAE